MSKLVRIKHIQDYDKVCYYSVCINQDANSIDKSVSLFDSFIKELETTENEKLNHILAWIKEIGNKYGAKEYFFRNEQNQGEAMGLPPNNIGIEPVYTDNGEIAPNNLRLYCHRLNENVVILMSGGLKTADTPQNCPNVKSHFELANKLTIVLDNAFREKDIIWIDDFCDIDYSDNLTLYLEE